jgi:hypothetical protein
MLLVLFWAGPHAKNQRPPDPKLEQYDYRRWRCPDFFGMHRNASVGVQILPEQSGILLCTGTQDQRISNLGAGK